MKPPQKRDHGGNIDDACAKFGGTRSDWIDLSTGINPVPYPVPTVTSDAWSNLPDASATQALITAARAFWDISTDWDVLPTAGASAIISALPKTISGTRVAIPQPTYNEHQAAFETHGWTVSETAPDVQVLVHPNNPTGQVWSMSDRLAPLSIIDESFADVDPNLSFVPHSSPKNTIILKSFGKFWGLAGVRLGFAIGSPELIQRLRAHIGPWNASGPAIEIGTAALQDITWAQQTRKRLDQDAARLDDLVLSLLPAKFAGGCSLFRLYSVENAQATQELLAQHQIWSRVFPYSKNYIRLGLPHPNQWSRLESALRHA